MFDSKAGVFSQVKNEFPDVRFTGGSNIHASYATEKYIGKYVNIREAMKILEEGDISSQYFDEIVTNFNKMTFYISLEEFKAIMLHECYCYLNSVPIEMQPKMFKNPKTNNKFLSIATLGDFVGGVRFWTYSCISDRVKPLNCGFRFRIIKKKVDLGSMRNNIETELNVSNNLKESTKNYMDIKELKKERESKIRIPIIGE